MNWTNIMQGNFNISDHDATSAAGASSGNNLVVGGLLSANAFNPATASSAGVNLSPVAQTNTALDFDFLNDTDLIDFF